MIGIVRRFPTLLVIIICLIISPIHSPIQAATETVNVLFDTGHQVNASDIWGYQTMVTDLTSCGFNFAVNDDDSITKDDLAGNQILVIVKPDVELSPQEINYIQDFISSGYGLFIMSDGMGPSPTNHFNPSIICVLTRLFTSSVSGIVLFSLYYLYRFFCIVRIYVRSCLWIPYKTIDHFRSDYLSSHRSLVRVYRMYWFSWSLLVVNGVAPFT